ncbi:phosphoserine phosphatase [Marinobacterium aestuarii]|uniref:Histidinol-phosphatase n=1 Tax=Marinobacterium aestuarii TaxID=1821621 RepID=A0A1A9F515_9GAMM|nr:HAD family hydrolase [Marinobacterium aestuarii]ANG64813.1 phosphoserine phosphatase [Marinobacterium aestuarii]
MSLAIFDLDNTLLNGDSDHAWGEFLCAQGLVDATEYKQANDRFYQQYKTGTMDIFEFLEFALRPLAQHSTQQLQQWHDLFMQQCVEPMMLPKALKLLADHRARGDFLLIITATNHFVTSPIARKLGVDALLATDPEMEDGRYTGKVAGTPCFREGKVERLHHWLQHNKHTLQGSYFYSDSQNDLPLLELVENPVAVDADEILTRTATERGWPVISLRD